MNVEEYNSRVKPEFRKKAEPSPNTPNSMMNFIAPAAQQRWLGPGVAFYTPQFVEQVFRQALSGDLQSAWELFDMIEATSPRLAKNLNQIKDDVIAAGIKVMPFKLKGQKPTPSALEKAELVEEALNSMRPDPDKDENGWNDCLRDALDARGKGISVQEISWTVAERASGGMMTAPRCTRWVHPAWYGYEKGPGDGQLKLKIGGAFDGGYSNLTASAKGYTEFPDNKFIITVCKNKTGHPLGSAMLFTLSFWWAAANFSAEWFLNLAQLFGQPFRWATYDPNMTPGDQQRLIAMLQNMGSAGWAAFPAGTQMMFEEAMKNAGDTPQKALLDYWDTMCDITVLRQTLTTNMAPSGGARAGGEVHERMLGAAELSWSTTACSSGQQMVEMICLLNYDDLTECPYLSPPVEEEDEAEEIADILNTLSTAGFEPTDQALPELSERIGFDIQRKAMATDGGGGDDDEPKNDLKAKDTGTTGDELEEIAAKEAPAVAAAIRANFGPAVKIIRDSKSPAEASQRLRAHFAGWRPGQLVAAMEPALQKCAALGAAEASTQSRKDVEAQ